MYSFERDKILIVGAGLAGSTIARILAENSFKVVIIEKRNHVAGNVFDFINQKNERIHKYGPHLLHCRNNSAGLNFLSRFIANFLLKNSLITLMPFSSAALAVLKVGSIPKQGIFFS